jgi:hypothetical protein
LACRLQALYRIDAESLRVGGRRWLDLQDGPRGS